MKELVEALAPWPLAQGIVIGILVAAAGFWAMRRGLQDRNRREAEQEAQPVRLDLDDGALPVRIVLTEDERRLQWAAYQQLHHIEQNSFKIALAGEQLLEATERLTQAVNRGNDIKWNSTR